MKIPVIDLHTQYEKYRHEIDSAVFNVLAHGQYIQGPEISNLENELAKYVDVSHAMVCSSGTDALVLPLMKSLVAGDVVFTSPFTFFASAESISLAGATPVFIDIDLVTYNLDPEDLELKIKQTHEQDRLRCRSVIPGDLIGVAADYQQINKVARKYNLFVIEDAAQSFGADYHGKRCGSLAEIAATNFNPGKPLGCYGDGEAVFTDDSDIYQELISLRVHGQATSGNKDDNIRNGLNARLDTIQAAFLLEKLKIYDAERKERDRVAERYNSFLGGIVKTPVVPTNQTSVWAQYSIESDRRNKVRSPLQAAGVPTAVFYPIPTHLSRAYERLVHKQGDFPNSETASSKIFSLPMHPYPDNSVIEMICDVIAKAA